MTAHNTSNNSPQFNDQFYKENSLLSVPASLTEFFDISNRGRAPTYIFSRYTR